MAQHDHQLEGGTYEIIQNRLRQHGTELLTGLSKLNQARKDVFGAIETKLIGSERVNTANNCTPRDMVPIGGKFIFGYNVHIGLRSEMGLEDVFAIYEFRENTFHEASLELISDPQFKRDFSDLYKYYKNTVFAKFAVIGPHLFMKFHVGKGIHDFKTFKWLIQGNTLKYIDNRSDHEFRYPPQHDFEWQRTTRDSFRSGKHPHISIEDRLFVETIGGDLTIKVEDNTDEGSGIYTELVDNKDQTLDDAEIHYAPVGPVILLKIKPYQEKDERFLIYNEKLQEVRRVDTIKDSCVLLPDDHGLIFPKGYYLLSGEYKEFDNDLEDMVFEKRVASPNGEDFLYVFYNRLLGVYILLSYNLIEQKVQTPIICNGFSIFEDGVLIYFRTEDEPQKHHALQIWQTSFLGPDVRPERQSDSSLFKIGNKDIVRAMAECHEIVKLVNKENPYAELYMDLAKKSLDVADAYFWLGEADAFNLKAPLTAIHQSANSAIAEFEKVARIKKATRKEIDRVTSESAELVRVISTARLEEINEFVNYLGELRRLRGEVISAKERRYADHERIEACESDLAEQTEKLSQKCVEFLLQEEALQPYEVRVREQESAIAELKKVADAKQHEQAIEAISSELELLIEIVSNLNIEDATQTTRIIDQISAMYSLLNQVKAGLKNQKESLGKTEGIAEFGAQMKLLSQAVINFLDVCDTPEKCEAYLTKVMVQIEELEGKFSEFDSFIADLSQKREEVYNAFESRKLQLVEKRNKRANTLAASADRILSGIRNRVDTFTEINQINGYFAADLMIEKVRDIIQQLLNMDDTVKADDIQSRLKTVKENAVRQLKDRQDLYDEGENLIKLGKHRFTVNVQKMALTVVPREDDQYYHLAGTQFFERIDDQAFLETRDVWSMETVSESKQVYRAEFLAASLFKAAKAPDATISLTGKDDAALLETVQTFMGPRYTEGYTKGVHDADALKILKAFIEIDENLGLLTDLPDVRALAAIYWFRFSNKERRDSLRLTAKALTSLQRAFYGSDKKQSNQGLSPAHLEELIALMSRFLELTSLFPANMVDQAAEFLMRVLIAGERFPISFEAGEIYRNFIHFLKHKKHLDGFKNTLDSLAKTPAKAYRMVQEWVSVFIEKEFPGKQGFLHEVSALIFCDNYKPGEVRETSSQRTLDGFLGSHPCLDNGRYVLDFYQFTAKLENHLREVAPKYENYTRLKKELTERFAVDLRLEEFKPRVLSSFVRNRLLDKVYLPLIGDNLAKQMGAAGEQKRTDTMGMLLLISPPGYGKTTLMEYIADRLGLIFMKINGPAIGHEVTALDPSNAHHSSARAELEKLNLALEMGDNVMLYLDDIQHCNPEFLQKFISLCDAQRKIEGVYKGRARTYDLRGRKVCVVMAGNPYTESGQKFQIPDMLANRADTYNLGDIIGGERPCLRAELCGELLNLQSRT